VRPDHEQPGFPRRRDGLGERRPVSTGGGPRQASVEPAQLVQRVAAEFDRLVFLVLLGGAALNP
jgi:hypothetical protein